MIAKAKARAVYDDLIVDDILAPLATPSAFDLIVSADVLVYLGDRRLKTEDGIDVWPLGTFLGAVAGNTLWP